MQLSFLWRITVAGNCDRIRQMPPNNKRAAQKERECERESARRELEIEKSEKVAALSLSLEGGKSYNTRV